MERVHVATRPEPIGATSRDNTRRIRRQARARPAPSSRHPVTDPATRRCSPPTFDQRLGAAKSPERRSRKTLSALSLSAQPGGRVVDAQAWRAPRPGRSTAAARHDHRPASARPAAASWRRRQAQRRAEPMDAGGFEWGPAVDKHQGVAAPATTPHTEIGRGWSTGGGRSADYQRFDSAAGGIRTHTSFRTMPFEGIESADSSTAARQSCYGPGRPEAATSQAHGRRRAAGRRDHSPHQRRAISKMASTAARTAVIEHDSSVRCAWSGSPGPQMRTGGVP